MISSSLSLPPKTSTDSDPNTVKDLVSNLFEDFVDGFATLAMKDNSTLDLCANKNLAISITPAIGTHKLQLLGSDQANEFEFIDSRRLLSRSHFLRISIGNQSQHRLLISSPDLALLSIIRASIYSTSDNNSSSFVTSNPIRVLYSCKSSNVMTRILLQTFGDNSYDDIMSLNSTISTKCFYGYKSQHKYSCAYPDGNTYDLVVNCDGWTNNIVHTTCPMRKRIPTCNVMTTNGHCTLLSYNKSFVECSCDICTIDTRRRLTSSMVATQVSAMTLYVFDQYVNKMSESLSWDDIKHSIIIIITFVVVWVSTILLVPIKSRLYQTADLTHKSFIRYKIYIYL
jgi:hypothetical protein